MSLLQSSVTCMLNLSHTSYLFSHPLICCTSSLLPTEIKGFLSYSHTQVKNSKFRMTLFLSLTPLTGSLPSVSQSELFSQPQVLSHSKPTLFSQRRSSQPSNGGPICGVPLSLQHNPNASNEIRDKERTLPRMRTGTFCEFSCPCPLPGVFCLGSM